MLTDTRNHRPATMVARSAANTMGYDLWQYSAAKRLRAEAIASAAAAFGRLIRRFLVAPLVGWYRRQRADEELLRSCEIEGARAGAELRAPVVVAVVRFVRQHVRAPLARWSAERRTVRELMQLDDQILADIGIRRSDIRRVAAGASRRPAQPAAEGTQVHTVPVASSGVGPRSADNDLHPPLAA